MAHQSREVIVKRLILLSFMGTGLVSCQEPVPNTNAAEDARISRSMKEVAAGQARSEADVAKIEADRRKEVKDRQVEQAP